MVDEEVQEEQENVEMKAAETENGDSPDDDMDSLMNELEPVSYTHLTLPTTPYV